MTIQAKQNLVNGVEEQIGEYLTAVNTKKVVQTLNAELSKFDVQEIEAGDVSTELVGIFLNAKQVEGRSEKTINRYSYIIERMVYEIGIPIEKITKDDLRMYLTECQSRGLSDRSVEGIRSVMSSFFGWLWKEGILHCNPCANIGPIKYQKKIKEPFSAVEIEKLKSNCTNNRDRAVVYFLLSTGARISEVCALNRYDIDFQNLECTVLGKGNKERTVYIDSVTAMVLHKYLSERTDKYPALFVGIRDNTERMTPHGIRGMLTELGERSGVENVHPHRFRRTLATNLAEHGMPLQEVGYLLGHENINTTMTYVRVNKVNVKNSYNKYA